jgi:1,4-dihydroxy-6-naphthoate synthase
VTDPRPLLRIGFSPDPDDAFMWWPLLSVDGAAPALDTGRFRYEAVIDDIESLNGRSVDAELEITAMSCAQYPHVADRYALTACGASMGDAYGPKLVARSARTPESLRHDADDGVVIAVPGERTSAFGALTLMLGAGSFRHAVVPFDSIIERVTAGEFEAGLVIHEGQLTFGDAGLHLVADVGAWWSGRHDLPMPLGVNAVRRDLADTHGEGTLAEITATLLGSVRHALEHRDESIRFALRYARDMGAERADEFVRLYVNRWTLDFGAAGRAGVLTFLEELHAAGLTPAVTEIDFVAAAS